MKKIISTLTILFVLLISASGVLANAIPEGDAEVLRLYNPKTGEHLFTADDNE